MAIFVLRYGIKLNKVEKEDENMKYDNVR